MLTSQYTVDLRPSVTGTFFWKFSGAVEVNFWNIIVTAFRYGYSFWTAFRKWWKNIYECDISFKVVDILFGLPNDTTDVMFECLNFCILLAKQFIIDVHRMETRNSKDISFYEYLYRLKNRIKVEKHIALCKDKLSIFEKKWNLIDENL